MKYSVAVIIISDRASTGKREDGCLPVIKTILPGDKFELKHTKIVNDDPAKILTELTFCIENKYQLILTSGGTGCAPRDNTPEVTKNLLDKPTPRVDEAIRRFSIDKSPFAIYSRAVSGVAGESFVINLPGSPKAVKEILEFLLPTIEHPLKLIAGQVKDCQDELKK